MYWIYNLPNWLFELVTIGVFVGFSLAGMLPSRDWARRVHVQHSHNDIVGFYLAAITVLYGVTLGLVAIGAWTSYTETQTKVNAEAAALSSLYRSVGSLNDPERSLLQSDLRTYTRNVIDIDWPLQQRGIISVRDSALLDKFQNDFEALESTDAAQKVAEQEVASEFDRLEEARSIRLDSVTEELPSPLWTLIIVGALICIAATWFFHMESLQMHTCMTILFSMLLGLMIFMVAALDNPYRGKISVTSEPFQRVSERMIATPK